MPTVSDTSKSPKFSRKNLLITGKNIGAVSVPETGLTIKRDFITLIENKTGSRRQSFKFLEIKKRLTNQPLFY
jgi:hypothetical protein